MYCRNRCPYQSAWIVVLAVGVVVLAEATPAWAGAWTLPRNHWYFEYFYRYFGSKKTFDADGDDGRRPKSGVFQDFRHEWKLEYGFTDWWNFYFSIPYISARYHDDTTNNLRTGIGDMTIRTKFRLLNHPIGEHEEPLVGSVQFSWKMPYGYNTIKNPIGKGQFDFEVRGLLSRAIVFWPRKAELNTQRSTFFLGAGRRQRSAEPPPRIVSVDRDMAIRQDIIVADKQSPAPPDDDMPPVTPPPDNTPAPSMTSEMTPANQQRYDGIAFWNLEAAVNFRNEAPANEFPLYAEIGVTPFKRLKRLMLISSIETVISERMTHERIENYSKWGLRGVLNVYGDGFASVLRAGGGPTVNVEVGYNDIFAGVNTADAFEIFGKLGIFY